MARGSAYRRFQTKRCIPAAFEGGSGCAIQYSATKGVSSGSFGADTLEKLRTSPRRKSPVECLRWNSSAKRNSGLRRQEDFFPQELPAAAAYLDSRRVARGWHFGVQKDVRPVMLCARPTAVAVSRRPGSRTRSRTSRPPNRPAQSPGRE